MFTYLFKHLGVKTPYQELSVSRYIKYVLVVLTSVAIAGLFVFLSDTLGQFVTMHGTTAIHLRLGVLHTTIYRILGGIAVVLSALLIWFSYKLPLAEKRMIGTRLELYRPKVKRTVRLVGILGCTIFLLLILLGMLY